MCLETSLVSKPQGCRLLGGIGGGGLLNPPIGSASNLDIRLACRIDRAVARAVPDG
jgi:hypothetical protein